MCTKGEINFQNKLVFQNFIDVKGTKQTCPCEPTFTLAVPPHWRFLPSATPGLWTYNPLGLILSSVALEKCSGCNFEINPELNLILTDYTVEDGCSDGKTAAHTDKELSLLGPHAANSCAYLVCSLLIRIVTYVVLNGLIGIF